MRSSLPLEKPLRELEEQIEELKRLTAEEGLDRSAEIEALGRRAEELRRKIFSHLTPWDQVQLSRHPERPYTLDYIERMCTDFFELHGDRRFGDDPAIVAGVAFLEGRPVAIIGHQKGRNVRERQYRNFGQAKAEGYRKALRVMRLAAKFRRPIICLVDTPGADCLVDGESRGVSEAIAVNQREMFSLPTPIIVVIIGEGGSGGAIGIGVGDYIMMLEHAFYSVITPEGCASIIWPHDEERGPAEAAAALKLTARDALEWELIDEIIFEPLGGAHRDPAAMAETLKAALLRALDHLTSVPLEELLEQRYHKFRRMGIFMEAEE